MINREGSPWFVSADVCRVLEISNPTMAMRRLHEAEKGLYRIETLGGPQMLNVVSESGLYKLIMRSDKDSALAFQDWIATEVLPSIRKHGAYIAGQEKVATGEMSREELLARAVKAADSVLAEMEQRALGAEQLLRISPSS